MIPIQAKLIIFALVVVLSSSTKDEIEKAGEDSDSSGADHPPESDQDHPATKSHVAWGYDNETAGPSLWPTLYPNCGGSNQSPINIDTAKAQQYEYNDLITFKHYKDVAKKVTVKNNGHTVVATFDYLPALWRPSVSGGQLTGTYEFEQLHFHWGVKDSKKRTQLIDKYSGAEHTIDGKRTPLEMHIVHRNVKYKTLSEAVNKTEGILVLAATFEMDTSTVMPLLISVENVIHLVSPFNGSATLKPRSLASVLPDNTEDFYHYRGSLTTPGCQETVDWIVFENPAHVIFSQIEMLTKLRDQDNKRIMHNYRPTQELNDRKVYHMVYKKLGAVVPGSSAAHKLQSVSQIHGFLLLATALCKFRWQ